MANSTSVDPDQLSQFYDFTAEWLTVMNLTSLLLIKPVCDKGYFQVRGTRVNLIQRIIIHECSCVIEFIN